jgi:V/A-type H+-transporting ATPase subunit I
MSIVKMKKFRMIAMREDREKLMRELQKFGCVEVSAREDVSEEVKSFGLEKNSGIELAEMKSRETRLNAALKLLDKYAYVKTALFPSYPEIKLDELFDPKLPEKAHQIVRDIEANDSKLSKLYAEETRIKTLLVSLELWKNSPVPLDVSGTENVEILLGTIPAAKSFEAFDTDARRVSDEIQLIKVGADREQQGVAVFYHRSHAEEMQRLFREYGFSKVYFEGCSGSAEENIAALNERLAVVRTEQEATKLVLASLGSGRETLKLYYDRLMQDIEAESAKLSLVMSERAFLLEGWVIADKLKELETMLSAYCCAFESRDPEAGEDVPIKLKSNKLTSPLNMVTEMYSLPKYTNVDPNPLIAFWFCAFFGIMYADFGYGIVLLLLGLIVGPKVKKPGTFKYMTGLLVECGIATMVFGWLFGSFFGDSLNYFGGFLGLNIDMSKVPLWGIKDPGKDPMWFMYASLVVGGIHLVVGMIIKAVILIRDGHPLAALFDVGSWWLLFAGIGVGALKGNWYVALAGALALVLTQGRDKPTFVGKAIGGLKSLYDITSWLGDILSYTRLMALMLAGSVIAQVFNMLGNMAGGAVPSRIVGLIVFLLIFVVTQLFNMAINIIGTFVHAARLQYLEFFGKFYEEGGRAFKPFNFKTKYTQIVKEEK